MKTPMQSMPIKHSLSYSKNNSGVNPSCSAWDWIKCGAIVAACAAACVVTDGAACAACMGPSYSTCKKCL